LFDSSSYFFIGFWLLLDHMTLVQQIFIFVFGTLIGSFLSVIIWRLRVGENFLSDRSCCPHCRHVLSWHDLVPLLSFVWLRGRCRYCTQRISCSYFLIELSVGLLFLLSARSVLSSDFIGISSIDLANLFFIWTVISILTVVFVYDLRYMLILPIVTLPAAITFCVANLALGMQFWRLFLAIIVGAGFFGLQYIFSQGKWIGGGDIHLGILMGAILGWPKILLALFIAYILGSAVGLGLLLFKKSGWKSELPLGTFLSIATVTALLYGDIIIRWYLDLI
jgi:prepilin signal peptidase PulO-like enzyme (type II secretory pathway)